MHSGGSLRVYTEGGTFHCSIIEITEQVRAGYSASAASSDTIFDVDIGKVLAGIQVPSGDTPEFSEYLKNLGYPYVEETENEVYKRFLRG